MLVLNSVSFRNSVSVFVDTTSEVSHQFFRSAFLAFGFVFRDASRWKSLCGKSKEASAFKSSSEASSYSASLTFFFSFIFHFSSVFPSIFTSSSSYFSVVSCPSMSFPILFCSFSTLSYSCLLSLFFPFHFSSFSMSRTIVHSEFERVKKYVQNLQILCCDCIKTQVDFLNEPCMQITKSHVSDFFQQM